MFCRNTDSFSSPSLTSSPSLDNVIDLEAILKTYRTLLNWGGKDREASAIVIICRTKRPSIANTCDTHLLLEKNIGLFAQLTENHSRIHTSDDNLRSYTYLTLNPNRVSGISWQRQHNESVWIGNSRVMMELSLWACPSLHTVIIYKCTRAPTHRCMDLIFRALPSHYLHIYICSKGMKIPW